MLRARVSARTGEQEKSHRIQSGIRQQDKTATKIQCCAVSRRINEADRFVSGLIDFLIQLY